MEFDIRGNPDYGILRVELEPGETFYGESGALSYASGGIKVRARTLGGVFKAVFRKMLAGESLLVGEYSTETGGFASLSPTTPGAVLRRTLQGEQFFLTRGTFLGCTEGVVLKTKFAGLRGLFSGEGAFLIRAEGEGDVFFNSYGAVVEREVEGGLVVDTGHVVAWEESLSYTIGGAGGIKSTLFSGEGLTMRFNGRGRIWLQTRTLPAFSSWITPHLM